MKAFGMILLASFLIGLASIKVALALLFLATCASVFYWICTVLFSTIGPHSVSNPSAHSPGEEIGDQHMVPGSIGVSENEDVVYRYDDAVKGRALY